MRVAQVLAPLRNSKMEPTGSGVPLRSHIPDFIAVFASRLWVRCAYKEYISKGDPWQERQGPQIGLRLPLKCQTSRAIHSRAEAQSGKAAPRCHTAKP